MAPTYVLDHNTNYRYPPDSVSGGDPNNNLHHQLMQMQWAAAAAAAAGRPNGSAAMSAAQVQQAVAAAAAAQQAQVGGPTRGRSRESRPGGGRGVDPEQRRRAQSKSPARAAAAQENPGISKKFREFKEWCKGSKSHSQLPDVVDFGGGRVPLSAGPLKSNLKKNLSSDLAPSSAGNPADSGDVSDSNDNRKVHFNKFATVQMME